VSSAPIGCSVIKWSSGGWLDGRVSQYGGRSCSTSELRHLALWFVLPPSTPSPRLTFTSRRREGSARSRSWICLRSHHGPAALARRARGSSTKVGRGLAGGQSRICVPWSVPLIERVKSARALLPSLVRGKHDGRVSRTSRGLFQPQLLEDKSALSRGRPVGRQLALASYGPECVGSG